MCVESLQEMKRHGLEDPLPVITDGVAGLIRTPNLTVTYIPMEPAIRTIVITVCVTHPAQESVRNVVDRGTR